jgi:hypothetical protein
MSVKSENFERISENRINKIVTLISKLSNLMNPSFYEYTDKQIDEMFNRIQKELDKSKKDFKDNSKKKHKVEL